MIYYIDVSAGLFLIIISRRTETEYIFILFLRFIIIMLRSIRKLENF